MLSFARGGFLVHAKAQLLVGALLGATPSCHAAEADAKAAQVLISAWQCSIYAELKGDAAEQERLFSLGYDRGKQFMAALIAGHISEEDGQKIPLLVRLLVTGPTSEFVLGRIFEAVSSDAYEKVTAQDERGLPLAPGDYVIDADLKTSIASTRYVRANCGLLHG